MNLSAHRENPLIQNLTRQNPRQLIVAQELINKVKSKCCGIKGKKIIFSDGYIHMARIVCLSGGGCALHRYLGGDGQERTFIMIRRGG